MHVLRRATSADAHAIVQLVERAYRGEPSRAGWTTEADLLDGQRTDLEQVQGLLAAADQRLLVVEEASALIACVLLSPEPDAVLLGMFAVAPERQRGGLGKQLLAEAERVMRDELGARRGRMTVLQQRHELLAFYARRGWLPTGARAPFPYGQPRFGLPKRDDLVFLVLEKPLS